ncbi:MAG: hypothetical protein ACK4UN_01165 [Limisphaerales bacterium]
MKLRGMLGGAALTALLLLVAHSAQALSITNVMPVNVTPSSFTFFFRTLEPATPSLQLYADENGLTNLAGQLAVETFPLHTGNPAAIGQYERRQSRVLLKEKTRNSGLMQIKVSGAKPDTTYFYQLKVVGTNGTEIVFPTSGPLPSVTTASETTFTTDSKHLLIEIPGEDVHGQVLALHTTNSVYGISAVVGDGAGTNQVFVNLNELLAQVRGTNHYNTVGTHEFTAELFGPGLRTRTQRYTILLTSEFVVGGGSQQAFQSESLLLTLGKAVLRAGDTNSILISATSTAALTNITFVLNLETNRFSSVNVESILPGWSATATESTTAGHYVIALQGAAPLNGPLENIARLHFQTHSNQNSSIVHLRPLTLTASRIDGVNVTNLFVNMGKIVVIAEEPLLEATVSTNLLRNLILYGKQGSSYGIEFTSNLGSGDWTHLTYVPMTSLEHELSGLSNDQPSVFYRAYELAGEQPILEARVQPNGNRALQIFGKPGAAYQVQYTENLSGVVTWHPLLNITLSNSFDTVENLGTNANVFYRLVQ